MKAHPQFDAIKEALADLAKKGVAFSGVCYRCTEPQFAAQIVSGLGSKTYGGRWNPKNAFATVYLCETAEAALEEYLARGRRMKIPDHRSMPMVMAGVKVKVQRLLDITNSEAERVVQPFLDAERIHWRGIQDRREAASQAIGRAAHEICFSGLIVRSQALAGVRNIVIFPHKLSRSEGLSAPTIKRTG